MKFNFFNPGRDFMFVERIDKLELSRPVGKK